MEVKIILTNNSKFIMEIKKKPNNSKVFSKYIRTYFRIIWLLVRSKKNLIKIYCLNVPTYNKNIEITMELLFPIQYK